MERTYLIQRLNLPFNNEMAEIWSFGGGLKNGGLSKEAMELLRPIFSFDYMGSAEFKFGAIPKCFQEIARKISEYIAWECVIENKPIHIISKKEDKKEIKTLLNLLAKGKVHLKDSSHFEWALGIDKYMKRECDTIGWLELDNNFIFFIDKTAFEKTAALFDLIPNPENVKS